MSLASCLGDGGVLIGKEDWGTLKASVFGSPAPLRAGPADISLLLQADGKPALTANVSFRWTSLSEGKEWLPPCCSMTSDQEVLPAVLGHSGNRLLYSAMLPIKSSGDGRLDIQVEYDGQTHHASFELSAAPPPAPTTRYWPWLAMTPLAILGFVIHQKISRRT
ncbi:MAG: hypothetical protein WEB60_15140 [Terrimicrobiaceae bacterium]